MQQRPSQPLTPTKSRRLNHRVLPSSTGNNTNRQKDKVCNRRLSADRRRLEPTSADRCRVSADHFFFNFNRRRSAPTDLNRHRVGADRRGRRRLTTDRSRSAPIGGLSAVALSAPIAIFTLLLSIFANFLIHIKGGGSALIFVRTQF